MGQVRVRLGLGFLGLTQFACQTQKERAQVAKTLPKSRRSTCWKLTNCGWPDENLCLGSMRQVIVRLELTRGTNLEEALLES